jgi:hypothetical protein
VSTHREIEEVYVDDVIKKGKMVKEKGESLGEMPKGDRTLAQIEAWLKKRRKKSTKA